MQKERFQEKQLQHFSQSAVVITLSNVNFTMLFVITLSNCSCHFVEGGCH